MIDKLFAALALILFGAQAQAECSFDKIDLRGDWGQARFSVEVADDEQERATGLMHRDALSRHSGMIFFYPMPTRVGFWMKNTLIPLDMIFINETGVVTHIHENAIPHDETVIEGGDGVFAVLEVNAGIVAQYNMDIGTEVRHPNFTADTVVWNCD